MKRALIFLGLGAVALSLASCNSTNGTTNTTSNVETTTNQTTTTIEDDYKLSISCPSGAPLMAISGAVEVSDIENKKLTIIEDTTTLPALFQAYKEDIIVAPVNAGTKLYNAGKSKYKLASVVTWGNTYFASQKTDFKLEDMNGAGITLFGADTINAAIANYVLAKKNITPSEILYPNPDVVAGANKLLISNADAMVMTADPVLTVAKNQLAQNSKTVTSYSIADLYKELTNHNYPQAAVFVNEDAYNLHKGKFEEFFNAVKTTCEEAVSNTEKVATKSHDLGIAQPAAVLTKAIPGCNLKYVKASDAKVDLAFAATEEGLKSFFGNKAPDDAFYLI